MPQHTLGDLTLEALQLEAEVFAIEDLSSPAADLVDTPVPASTGECSSGLCGTPGQSGGASASGSGSSLF